MIRARVFEDAEVDGFLVRANAPRDRMFGLDVHPTDEV